MSTEAKGIARPGRILPFDAVRLPGGEVAVLVAAIGMKNADLVFFDAGGKALRRADLGEDSDPFDVELWRGKLWVADATRYRFEAVGLDGTKAAALEDGAFLDELASERHAIEQWRDLRRFAQVGLVAIPLLGALLLWRLGASAEAPTKRAAPMPASRKASPAPQVRWLEPRPAFVRRVRLFAHGIAWLSLLLVVGWTAHFMLRYRDHVFSVSGLRVLLPMLGFGVAMGVVYFFVYRAIPRRFVGTRLGVTQDALHFAIPDPLAIRRRIVAGAVAWKDVYYDGKRLLVGEHLLLLSRFPLGALFEPNDVARVLERIPKANVVSGLRLGRLAIAASRRLRLLFIAWLILAAAVLALELARHL